MEAVVEPAAPAAKWMTRLGWALTVLVALFLTMDGVMKLMDVPQVKTATLQLGWPLVLDRTLGVVDLVCMALYAFPRTAVLGAILTTGLCGGAAAAHLRLGDPLFSHVLFGVYIGVMAWGGLWLRDARLRALMPIRD